MQRYSGYVITLLPVGLAGILFVISPTYMTVMLDNPPETFGLPTGVIFFILGLISMGIGYVLIRRIVDIKV
jgi:tight adherence protein B